MHRFGEDRLEEIFERASDLSAEQREAFLTSACGGDEELRGEIESLLRAEACSGDFLRGLQVDPKSEGVASAGAVGPGRMIGPYQLLSKLGVGGMSTVYLACRADDQYRKRVAIKPRADPGPGDHHRQRCLFPRCAAVSAALRRLSLRP